MYPCRKKIGVPPVTFSWASNLAFSGSHSSPFLWASSSSSVGANSCSEKKKNPSKFPILPCHPLSNSSCAMRVHGYTFFQTITYLSTSSSPNENEVKPASSATSCLEREMKSCLVLFYQCNANSLVRAVFSFRSCPCWSGSQQVYAAFNIEPHRHSQRRSATARPFFRCFQPRLTQSLCKPCPLVWICAFVWLHPSQRQRFPVVSEKMCIQMTLPTFTERPNSLNPLHICGERQKGF